MSCEYFLNGGLFIKYRDICRDIWNAFHFQEAYTSDTFNSVSDFKRTCSAIRVNSLLGGGSNGTCIVRVEGVVGCLASQGLPDGNVRWNEMSIDLTGRHLLFLEWFDFDVTGPRKLEYARFSQSEDGSTELLISPEFVSIILC